MKHRRILRAQRGIFLLEVLIAVVIFAIGILAMISMQAVTIAAQNDSQYRVEAEHLIDDLIAQIRIGVTHDSNTGNVDAASFAAFAHRPTGTTCNYSLPASASAVVTSWINTVRGLDSGGTALAGKGLPGITDARIQILADNSTAGINQVRITLCWQGANDKAAHRHSVVAYID